MNQDKVKVLQESIKLQEGVMIDTQTQIRLAHDMLDRNQKAYKRAMEEKINLQDKLIQELQKIKK
jgi:hypothetical protein